MVAAVSPMSPSSRGAGGEKRLSVQNTGQCRLCAKSAVFSVFNHNKNVSLVFCLFRF